MKQLDTTQPSVGIWLRRVLLFTNIAIVLLATIPIIFFIAIVTYVELQPDGDEQLAQLANLPVNTELGTRQVGSQIQPDPQIIVDALLQQLPVGTPRHIIHSYLEEHSQICDHQEKDIKCHIKGITLFSSYTYTVWFFFDSNSQLENIIITYSSVHL
jgi:hypothetical protein